VSFGKAVVQLASAAIGGGIGGSFVVVGVNLQFRRQSEAACRALLLEVQSNYEALAEMIKVPSGDPWPNGKAHPGWLHRSVWDTQLSYVVPLLDRRTLELVVRAYATLDSIPDMKLANVAHPGVPYAHGGWINERISTAYEAFRPARDYLGDLVVNQSRWTRLLPKWVIRVAARARRACGG